MAFADLLQLVEQSQSLSRAQAKEAISAIMSGRLAEKQIAAFLQALKHKGETIDEIAGAAEAMRDASIAVRTKSPIVVDTCGTGGDGRSSFNISTAVAFVVAGAGYPVAKHGNRSVSSTCGSADVLEEMNIRVEWSPEEAARCLDEIGIAFLFAPRFHPAMKNVMPVRKALGVRTIFNILGPLTNPARPNVQVIGIYDAIWVKPIAEVISQLGCRNGYVVHEWGHDEIILAGPTEVAEIIDGNVRLTMWSPADFGLKPESPELLKGGDRKTNAGIMQRLLKGEKGHLRNVICVNAAAAIAAASRQAGDPKNLRPAFLAAEESIDSGKAWSKLVQLQKASHK
jgi:anthranilate phosphoribosyltransferase